MSNINKAFYTPPLNPNGNKSAIDNVNENIKKTSDMELKQLKLTEGKISSLKEGFIPYPRISNNNYNPGKTIFIPKDVYPGIVPPPSYNLGWGTGLPCNGLHCGKPVQPTMSGMQKNMIISPLTEEASKQFPPGLREGNSTDSIDNYNMYIRGTNRNPGPYNLKVSD